MPAHMLMMPAVFMHMMDGWCCCRAFLRGWGARRGCSGASSVRCTANRQGGAHGGQLQRHGKFRGLHEGRFLLNIRRSEEHTSELQSLMRISYAVFCLKK